MSLFDLVVNTKAGEDELEVGEEDAFSGMGSAPTQSTPSAPSMSMPSSTPMEMPSFSAPSSDPAPMSMSSSPSMDEPSAPISMPGGFVPPGGMAAVDNKPQSHSAVKPVSKDDDENVIRIVIDDSLQRAEREKLELEQLEQQQKEHQLLATTIDPSVLVDEEVGVGDGPTGHDIFANFNASGLRSIVAASEEPDPNDHPSNIRDGRSYDQIKEKLSDLSDTLAEKGSINIDSRLLDRGVKEEDLENSAPAIKVPKGLNVLE